MKPTLQFDQLYIVSDLHFGGEPGFQIFGSQAEMIWLIQHLTQLDSDQQIGLVINGDFIDFLAEAPSRHFDPDGAIKKLERVALQDPTFGPIFKELKIFLSTPNRKLIINLGNHDLELTLPWVRERLIEILTDNNEQARARLNMIFDGSGVFANVGNKSVLCVHGNEVDAWNPADFEKLRQISRDYQFGRPVENWIPNAGSKMVIDVMNPVKRNYPFVDLLKPEAEGVVPTLLACDPKQLSNLDSVLGLAGAAGSWLQTKISKPRGMLGEERENVAAAGSVAGNSTGLTQALINRNFPSNGRSISTGNIAGSDAANMLLAAEQQTLSGVNPLNLVQGKQAEQLGGLGAFISWLKDKSPSEVLREALDKLDEDRSFDPTAIDETFTSLDKEVQGNIDYLIAGHTHLERALKRQKGNGYYFNSGTWARLIKIEPATRQSPEKFKALFDILKSGTMAKLDATPGLISKFCTVVAIVNDGHGVLGELRHVTSNASGAAGFSAVAGSQLRSN
ncbi:metallophosphoesterase [Undibacterium sp. Di24W]|uniref:metallophosphoesterase n=1 Tax=Undibacterium sp. Di24W TaxID=3413033 RepID=UPI003BF11296